MLPDDCGPGPLIPGRPGDWPYAGYFRGHMERDGRRVDWAGRVDSGDDPIRAWSASRAATAALSRGGPVDADRRRALSILWARLDSVDRAVLGPAAGADLCLLLLARDAEGASVSAVGLAVVHSVGEDRSAAPWIRSPHPLLCAPGLPTGRPGAVSVDALPGWLVGVPEGDEDRVLGGDLRSTWSLCGVHR